MTTTTSWYEPAQAARGDYARRVAAIRADTRLSPDGKRIALAKAWSSTKVTTDRLRQEATEAQERERRRLEARLFSIKDQDPAQAVNYRDALDRAQRAQTPDAAAGLLTQAERTNDSLLGRAVLQVAVDRWAHPGWQRVARAWMAQHPSSADYVEGYVETITDDASPAARLVQSFHSNLDKPQEISHLSDQEVHILAEG
jgi:hypothetical protein